MAVTRLAMLHSRIERKNLPLSRPLLLFIIFVGRVASRSYMETEYNQRKYQTEGPDLDPAVRMQSFSADKLARDGWANHQSFGSVGMFACLLALALLSFLYFNVDCME